MSHIRNLAFLTLLLLLPVACTPSLEPLEAEVMAIHDEVMPLMGEMQQMRGQLKTEMISLDSSAQIPFLAATMELQKGEDMMWDWMNQYKKPDLQSDTAKAYLEQQKFAIQLVADQMKHAIQLAKQRLK